MYRQLVFSIFILATIVVLPRIGPAPPTPRQRTSADRPEHPLLTPLTSNPLLTMLWHLLGLWPCLIWRSEDLRMRSWPAQGNMAKRCLQAGAATLAATIAFGFVLLGLGAALEESRLPTLLLALQLALLVVWPVVQTLGLPSMHASGLRDRYRMTRVFCRFEPDDQSERELTFPVIGTLVGAWLGAMPLPLDWDRPWQSYPLTPALGAVVGFLGGCLLSASNVSKTTAV